MKSLEALGYEPCTSSAEAYSSHPAAPLDPAGRSLAVVYVNERSRRIRVFDALLAVAPEPGSRRSAAVAAGGSTLAVR